MKLNLTLNDTKPLENMGSEELGLQLVNEYEHINQSRNMILTIHAELLRRKEALHAADKR